MKNPLIRSVFVGVAMLAVSALHTNAAPIAYENFEYGPSVNLTIGPSNGGTGWTGAWATTGVNGMLTSGSGQSLAFDQAPPNGFITDGSTHVFSNAVNGNERDWSPVVDLATQTLYFTALIRLTAGADVVDMRATFWDGAGASGNMRANIGISDGGLFVGASTDGYITTGSNYVPSLVANNTTYLLAMKRTGTDIFGALIPATGDLNDLVSEPVWQVTQAGSTGVDLQSIRINIDASGGGGIRMDELRVTTDWASAVSGLVVPISSVEPRITSFTSVGGGVWEVTLKGAASTSFEFRSSTTLDFSPGTLLTGLTQVGVAAPAGTISGANSEFITTDGSGDATARMTLTGDPKDFIRAQTSTP